MESRQPSPPTNSLPSPRQPGRVTETIKDNFLFLLAIVAIFWGLEILDIILLGILDNFGIKPRYGPGLPGIISAPFLHLGFGHLISNTVPFFVLGGLVLLGGRKTFISVSAFIAIVGGLALWLLGPGGTNHIGASLVIFGYLGFLLARGIFEKSGFWFGISLVILILYGGMIFGVLPGQPGISWQGHLFGFIAGILAAKMMFTGDKKLF